MFCADKFSDDMFCGDKFSDDMFCGDKFSDDMFCMGSQKSNHADQAGDGNLTKRNLGF